MTTSSDLATATRGDHGHGLCELAAGRPQAGERDAMEPCPACGQPDALVALGTRLDRPYRWRPWISRHTALYLCACCDAIVTLPHPARAEFPAVARRPLAWGHA